MIKRLASLMTIIMAFSFVFNVPVADAKKFGGGKSFGQSYKTAPAPKQPAAAPQQAGKQQADQNGSSRKGMLGGMLGGLLAGGLIASLLSGGGFGGIQFMDILILGLLGFVLFKVFRTMTRAKAMAGNHGTGSPFGQDSGNQQQPPSLGSLIGKDKDDSPQQRSVQPDAGFQTESGPALGGFGVSDVPMDLPAGFNLDGFMNGARDHYRTLQEAWNKNDLETMQEYLGPELFQQLKAERASLSGDQHTEVMFVDAELARADHNASVAEISVRFTGKYRDTVENIEEDITDIWHLQRDLTQDNGPWLIVGIES